MRASGLADDGRLEPADDLGDHLTYASGVGGSSRSRVLDAQAAADVDHLERVPGLRNWMHRLSLP